MSGSLNAITHTLSFGENRWNVVDVQPTSSARAGVLKNSTSAVATPKTGNRTGDIRMAIHERRGHHKRWKGMDDDMRMMRANGANRPRSAIATGLPLVGPPGWQQTKRHAARGSGGKRGGRAIHSGVWPRNVLFSRA